MLNKKGATSIAALITVMAALFILSLSLYTFITESSKVKADFKDLRVLDNTYSRLMTSEFYFEKVAGDSAAITDRQLNGVSDIETFKSGFLSNFKSEINRYNFEEDYLKQIKDKVDAGEYSLEISNSVLVFSLKQFSISYDDSELNGDAKYIGDLTFKINLNELGRA